MEADNIQAIIDIAQEAAGVDKQLTTINGIPVLVNGDNVLVLTNVLEAADKRADAPRRRKGTSNHSELSSFIDHVNRFKDEHSAVFADSGAVRLVAILDYHCKGAASPAQWGEHRSVYVCPLSEQWRLWTANSGVKMTQDAFAQFIEDNMGDLATPTGNGADKEFPMPADVLTMARNLVIRSKGEFSRSINPTTGESSLVCKNENDQTSTKIPRAFVLGIPVFEAGHAYRIEARMRMDLSGGRPAFSYVLYQPQAILRDAFGEVRDSVKYRTELPVFAGTPE